MPKKLRSSEIMTTFAASYIEFGYATECGGVSPYQKQLRIKRKKCGRMARAPFVSASDLLRRSSYFLSSLSAAANVWSLIMAYGLYMSPSVSRRIHYTFFPNHQHFLPIKKGPPLLSLARRPRSFILDVMAGRAYCVESVRGVGQPLPRTRFVVARERSCTLKRAF